MNEEDRKLVGVLIEEIRMFRKEIAVLFDEETPDVMGEKFARYRERVREARAKKRAEADA